MPDTEISYNLLVFVKNTGHSYDPAPLYEFNLHEQPHPPTLMPGDVLCAWSKLSGEAEGRNHYYKVLERVFFLHETGYDVRVLVEEIENTALTWTGNFD